MQSPDKLIDYLTSDFRQRRAVAVFCKAVILIVALKMAFLWPVSHTVMKYHTLESNDSMLKSLFMLPSSFAENHIDLFYGGSILFLVIAFFVRWNYITAFLFCWLIINLNRINFLLNNGADSVLLLLSCSMIGMVTVSSLKREKLKIMQHTVYNLAVLLAQVQIILIYFVSGWDKIISSTWRSGEAFARIPHLDFMFNPAFKELLSDGFTNTIVAWITIGFELSFAVLVWVDRTRLMILLIGVVFHLLIGITLSLPDFAAIMIVSYLIFLKDSDYEYLRLRFKRPLL